MDTLELLLHPVRVRILHAMSGGLARTTSDLLARLPDVSKATVYRHVSQLAEAGVLEVVSEHRVHGAMERLYRLHRPGAVIDPDEAAAMSLDEHRHGFTAAMAVLVAEFNTYLDQAHADPTEDKVGYRQIPLWLNEDELTELINQMRNVLVSRMDNQPAPGRRLYLLSPIVFPIENTRPD
jgi:DNA-binding transcriptional ArsR family regulator